MGSCVPFPSTSLGVGSCGDAAGDAMWASWAVRSRGQPRLSSNTSSCAGDTEDAQAAESVCEARAGTTVLEQGCVLCAVPHREGKESTSWAAASQLCGKPGCCSAPDFDPRKPSSFQDAPATCWERGRTCPVTTRRGSAPACPTWWAPNATSARPGTGTWRAAGAAGPATATPAAPSAPTATRYHCHHAPSTLGWSPVGSALIFLWRKNLHYLLLIAQSIKSACPVAPSAPSHLWEPPQRGTVIPNTFCSCFPLPVS